MAYVTLEYFRENGHFMNSLYNVAHQKRLNFRNTLSLNSLFEPDRSKILTYIEVSSKEREHMLYSLFPKGMEKILMSDSVYVLSRDSQTTFLKPFSSNFLINPTYNQLKNIRTISLQKHLVRYVPKKITKSNRIQHGLSRK